MTLWPLAWSSLANEAAIIPFPKEEVTPPVTKMYLVDDIYGGEDQVTGHKVIRLDGISSPE